MINDLQKNSLQTILNNEILLGAIKGVFDETIEELKPEIREGQDNSLLGEKYRSYETAKEIIKQGFINLLSYKKVEETKQTFNKAR